MLHTRVPNRIAWPLLALSTAIILFFPLRQRWLIRESDRRAMESLQAITSLEQLEERTLLLKTTDGCWIAMDYGPGWNIFAKDSEGRWYRSRSLSGTVTGYKDTRRRWRESSKEEKESLQSPFEGNGGYYAGFHKIESSTLPEARGLLLGLRFEEFPAPE